MVENRKRILTFMFLGGLCAFVLTFGVHLMLRWQVKEKVQSDLEISADLMLERVSIATQSAIQVLNKLAHSNGLACTSDDRFLYSEATRSSAWVDMVGLVDRNGNLVCTDVGQSSRQLGLLSSYKKNEPEINLSLSGSVSEGQIGDPNLSLLVIEHIQNGRRLVARIPGELIKDDPVRNDLRRFRTAMLSLGESNPWYILEPVSFDGDVAAHVSRRLDYLPFEAQISISSAAIDAVMADMAQIVHILGLVLGAIGLGLGYLIGRQGLGSTVQVEIIEDREFAPFLQPIVDLSDGSIVGCEVWAHWNNSDEENMDLNIFNAMPEEMPITREIMAYLMEATRDMLEPVIEDGIEIKVTFNLSADQLKDEQIVTDIGDIFAKRDISYQHLVFEVSDGAKIKDVKLARRVLTKIQSFGSEIALEDAGSGRSGLYNPEDSGIDIFKFDKELMDPRGSAGLFGKELIANLVEFASEYDMGVIAEGVEEESEINQLREMGITAAQGLLFSPPLPAKSFVELVRASRGGKKAASKGGNRPLFRPEMIKAA